MVWLAGAESDDCRPRPIKGRHVLHGAAVAIHRENMRVAVTVAILEIKQMAAVIGPACGAQAARRIACQDPRPIQLRQRRDPEIHHASKGGKPGGELAVRTDGRSDT
jgi:hypothetical protein